MDPSSAVMHFGQNMEILTYTLGEWWCEQAQN